MLSLALACVWAVAANVIAMLPSRKSHWPQAYVLMACGGPILVLMFSQHGAGVTLGALIAAASVLRWPLRYAVAWLRRHLGLAEPSGKDAR